MVFLHIDKKNCNDTCNMIASLDDYIGNKKNKIFILIFMEGCGPCNATRPEWKKLKNILSRDFLNKKDVIIASIDDELAEKLKHLKQQPSGFPTMRFIENGGNSYENYEDSSISTKDRTIDSFVEWIKLKTGENNISKAEEMKGGNKISRKNKNKKTKKWSLKYKKSINCKKPKGFSQKQYCKYGRK
jgi:hypothetical protein